jgi:hypothetical protein
MYKIHRVLRFGFASCIRLFQAVSYDTLVGSGAIMKE